MQLLNEGLEENGLNLLNISECSEHLAASKAGLATELAERSEGSSSSK